MHIFDSFIGITDLKTGCILALLFAVLNKVAGVYGLVAVLTGSGGSFAQISLYVYSVLALVALAWAINAVKTENAKRSLYFAHLFFADHMVSTAWTIYFAIMWWAYTPHDGARQANSDAQKEMILDGPLDPDGSHPYTDEQRALAAQLLWDEEKWKAVAILAVVWLCKLYFAALFYSYAWHLRRGSYRSLSLSKPDPNGNGFSEPVSALPEGDEDQDFGDTYHTTPWRKHRQNPSWGTFVQHGGVRKLGNGGGHTKSRSSFDIRPQRWNTLQPQSVTVPNGHHTVSDESGG